MKKDTITPPTQKQKRLVQAEVDLELFNQFESERVKAKVSKRKVIEYGIAKWLESVNPSSAAKVKHLFK